MIRYNPPPHVTFQTIDGEVIAINFERGTYHSMRGTAAAIWQALVDGAPIELLPALFVQTPGEATQVLAAFASDLVAAGLLQPTEPAEGAAPVNPAVPSLTWSEPSIESFDDMARDLLVDPIHDVDEAWPKTKAASGG